MESRTEKRLDSSEPILTRAGDVENAFLTGKTKDTNPSVRLEIEKTLCPVRQLSFFYDANGSLGFRFQQKKDQIGFFLMKENQAQRNINQTMLDAFLKSVLNRSYDQKHSTENSTMKLSKKLKRQD